MILKKFTLLELLIVIAIIAILASMLLPAINKTSALMERTACANNSKQLYLAYSMYNNDYQRQPALKYEITGTKDYLSGSMIKSSGIWQGYGKLYEDGYITSGKGKPFYCPSKSNCHQPDKRLGYEGTYGWGVLGPDNMTNTLYNNYWNRWCEYTVLIQEPIYAAHITPINKKMELNAPNTWLSCDTWGFCNYTTDQFWIPHRDGLNILFMDGHVKYSKLSMPTIVTNKSYTYILSILTGSYK